MATPQTTPSGSSGVPALPPGFVLDPRPTTDQPWLSAPIVRRAPGAHPDKPWLDAPIVSPAQGPNADAPWLNDPIVSRGGGGAIPPLPPGYTLDQPRAAGSSPNADQPWLNDPIVSQGNGGAIPPLPPGYTLDQPPPGPKDTSFGSALQQGAHDALTGVGSSVSLLSKDVGWKGGQNVGDALSGAIPAPANYDPATSSILTKVKAGHVLSALGDLPRAAVEGAPAVLGGLGAAAAGAALTPEILGGAAVGGALGAAGYGAASAFGGDANDRAAANGHATPTTGDQLAAAPTAIAQGVLNAGGLGRLPVASALLRSSPGYLKALTAGGVDAAGQAASNVAGQVGTTAGTQQGLTVDPSQVAAAAIQAGAARVAGKALSQTAGAAASGAGSAVKSVGMALAAQPLLKDMNPDQAASYTRLNNAYDGQDPARAGADPTTRMNALWKQTKAQVGQVVDAARATGQLDADTTASLKTALQMAAVHKSALDRNLLDKLNSETVSPQLAETLRNGLTDLDNLSQMVNYKQATGPFAALGAKLATPAAMIGGAAMALHGMPVEGIATMAAPWVGVGHGNIAGRYGAAVGGMLDKVAGTSLPPSLVLRAQAIKAAQAGGYDTSGNTVSSLNDTQAALQTMGAQQAAQTQAQAQAAADALARAKASDLVEKAANQVSGVAYKNSPEGIIARANLATRKKDILTQAAADGRLQQPMSQDQLDRVSIGLPPSDPVPVNVPLSPSGQPLRMPQRQTQGASLSPPSANTVRQQPVAPLGVSGTPQGSGGYRPTGWVDHLGTILRGQGVAPTSETIGKALGGLVASGQMTQAMGDHLTSNAGLFLGDRSQLFQQIVAQAMRNEGLEPPPIVQQPVSPLKYGAAVQSRQTLGNTLMQAADGEGDTDLKVAIARILTTPDVSAQRGIEQRLIAERLNDAAALERAKRLLPPELFRGQGK